MRSETNLTSNSSTQNTPNIGSRKSMEEQAYLRIKDHLFSGGMVPGQKIIYRELETFLGMSKTPILGALARLNQEKIVKLEHNRGYYVRKLDPDEIQQLYQIRIRLEEIAVEYAVDRSSEVDFGPLKKSLEAYDSYNHLIYDTKRLQLDLNFHLEIARIGGNPFLVPLLEQLYDQTRVGLSAVFMTPMIPKFKLDHAEIFEALKAREAKLVMDLIRKHEMRTLTILREQNE